MLKQKGTISTVFMYPLAVAMGLSILIFSTACSGSESVPPPEVKEQGAQHFPVMEGWKMAGEIKTFSPSNLYDYIDGAAELYLNYDFEELQVAEYTSSNNASIVMEVYRHRTPDHAFGIYSQERPGEWDYLQIGAQGYFDESILNFVSGTYYVKLSCFDCAAEAQRVLMESAKKIADSIGGKPALPQILKCFPDERKRANSEQFVAKNFMGYTFLHSGFKADYGDADGGFTLFIIEGNDPADCRKMLSQYLEKAGLPQKEIKEGGYTIPDRYHGDIDCVWKGRHIWGTIALTDAKLRSLYLKRIEENLKSEKILGR